jgi:hypothetical protein
MKAVKMLGADTTVRNLINGLRMSEMKAAKPFRSLLMITVVLCKYFHSVLLLNNDGLL